MAAEPRKAVVVGETRLPGPGRVLELSVQGRELGFAGGQYLIIDTGIQKPGGKTFKRPYSILSSDAEQTRCSIAAQRIADGPGSSFVNEVPVGQTITFSGPWGKWTVPDALGPGPVWVLATDTGITAALGLIRGERIQSRLADVHLLWTTVSADPFLSEDWVAAALPSGLGGFRHEPIPPVGHVERVPHARGLAVASARALAPAAAFLVGDGDIVAPVKQDLVDGGMDASNVRVEFFFHKPPK